MSPTPTTLLFADMPCLSDFTKCALAERGLTQATPVQAAVLPLLCGNSDVSADAPTGSGKTLAFVLPLVERLARRGRGRGGKGGGEAGGGGKAGGGGEKGGGEQEQEEEGEPLKRHQVGALVLSPTRELASQIAAVAAPFLRAVPRGVAAERRRGGENKKKGGGDGDDGKNDDDGDSDSDDDDGFLTSATLVGGSDPALAASLLARKGANVIFGTPGRVADALGRVLDGNSTVSDPTSSSSKNRHHHCLDLKTLDLLVLDEADRLLSRAFEAQVSAIVRRLPKQRRTGLFSATQTEAVSALARAGLRNAVRVKVGAVVRQAEKKNDGGDGDGDGSDDEDEAKNKKKAPLRPSVTPASLELRACVLSTEDKPRALVAFLHERASLRGERVIVYFLTCAAVDFFAAVLPRIPQGRWAGEGGGPLRPIALHGRMKQSAREAALAAFARGGGSGSGEGGKSGEGRSNERQGQRGRGGSILLATDVAARGLDVPAVAWTLQYDPPQDPDAFVHRAGRAARAGASGGALLFLCRHERSYVDFLRNRGVPIEEVEPPRFVEPESVPMTSNFSSSSLTSSIAIEGGEKEKGEENTGKTKKAAAPSLPPPPSADTINRSIRSASVSDRETMEKGARAFVSHVRGYKEHACRFIFRSTDLPLGPLATSLGLPRLPRMPELNGLGGGGGSGGGSGSGSVGGSGDSSPPPPSLLRGFEPLQGFDPDSVKYKDKNREKARQAKLAEERAARERREEERKERGARHASAAPSAPSASAPQQQQQQQQRKLPAAKRRAAADARDEEDLLADYSLLKRLKKGSISKEKFDEEFGRAGKGGDDGDDDSDDDSDDGDGGGDGRRKSKSKSGSKKSASAAAFSSSFSSSFGASGRGRGGRGGGGGRRRGRGGFVPSRK